MHNIEDIKRIIKKEKKILEEKYRVKFIGLFGSYLKGEPGEESDLDILVEFYESPDLFEFMALEEHLQNLLGTKVDLVSKRALKPSIGKYILKEVISI